MDTKYLFSYCQKIAVFRGTRVLLAKRYGEADYDGIFSFVGGKMERSDGTILEGLRREKNEEIGTDIQIKILLPITINSLFVRKDGLPMVLPHYYAEYQSGEVQLNPEEYSEYQWVELDDLANFEPKIANISELAHRLYELRGAAKPEEFELI
jgi:8-oxo-dGTP pyrophosphatase MutT (NUDIX family)